jgi:hypothetical protein
MWVDADAPFLCRAMRFTVVRVSRWPEGVSAALRADGLSAFHLLGKTYVGVAPRLARRVERHLRHFRILPLIAGFVVCPSADRNKILQVFEETLHKTHSCISAVSKSHLRA